MINRQHFLTYIYLLVYIMLSSGVILYNKVRHSHYVMNHSYFFSSFFNLKIYIVNNECYLLLIPLQWVLSTKYFNFPYPITLTMIHMGFSGVVAFFLIRVFKVRTLFELMMPSPWIGFLLYSLHWVCHYQPFFFLVIIRSFEEK